VTWCPCDGVHSTSCRFWPFRFGVQPKTFRAKYGDRLLDPEQMPPADVEFDKLPAPVEVAATGAISVEGYSVQGVTVERATTRSMSPEHMEALQRGRREAQERLSAHTEVSQESG
jgi:hypothetical protein